MAVLPPPRERLPDQAKGLSLAELSLSRDVRCVEALV